MWITDETHKCSGSCRARLLFWLADDALECAIRAKRHPWCYSGSAHQPEQQFSTAVISRLELLAWTSPGWRGERRKARLSRSTVCTSWCYLVLILAVAEERPLRWGIRGRKMSAAPETLVGRYLRIGQHIWLCGTRGALSAHQATANQPIDQPLVGEAFLKLCSHQGRVSGAQKGEKCHGQLDSNCWNTTQWYTQRLEEKDSQPAAGAAAIDCV